MGIKGCSPSVSHKLGVSGTMRRVRSSNPGVVVTLGVTHLASAQRVEGGVAGGAAGALDAGPVRLLAQRAPQFQPRRRHLHAPHRVEVQHMLRVTRSIRYTDQQPSKRCFLQQDPIEMSCLPPGVWNSRFGKRPYTWTLALKALEKLTRSTPSSKLRATATGLASVLRRSPETQALTMYPKPYMLWDTRTCSRRPEDRGLGQWPQNPYS